VNRLVLVLVLVSYAVLRSGEGLHYIDMDMDILIKSIWGNVISIDMSIDMDISGAGACRVFLDFEDFEDFDDFLDSDLELFEPFEPLDPR